VENFKNRVNTQKLNTFFAPVHDVCLFTRLFVQDQLNIIQVKIDYLNLYFLNFQFLIFNS
jgi:hypothetical protein